MKLVANLIMVLIFSANLFSQCVDTANVYTFTYNNKTYEVVKELKSWTDAAACAVERGGYLVEINDVNEQNAVYNAIISGAGISPTYTSIANGGGIAYVWIGATDQQTEGTWIWDGNNDNSGINFWTGQGANGAGNGLAIGGAYYNWGGTSTSIPKEPDNFGTGQHHAAIALAGWPSGSTMLGIAGEWNDIIGSSLLYFVIEKNSTSINENKTGSTTDLIIYPNPTDGIINFDLTYKQIEVYDFTGKLLKIFNNARSIDVTEFKSGTYIIHILEDSFVKKGKFILN